MNGSSTCWSVVAAKALAMVMVVMVILAVAEGTGEEEEGGEGAVSLSSSSSSSSSSSFPSSGYPTPLGSHDAFEASGQNLALSSPVAAPLKIDQSSIRFSSSSSHQEISHSGMTKVFPKPRLPTKERKAEGLHQGSNQDLQDLKKHRRPQEHQQDQFSPLNLPSTFFVDPSRSNLTFPSAIPLSMAPPSCSQVSVTSLECRVRTLDDAFGAKIPREDRGGPILSLSVACNQFLFFQSMITGSTFQGLEDLEELDIQWCKLSNLPAHTLRGLRHLKSLTVITHNSDWAALAMDLYKESLPESLEILTLTHNSIWTLPTGVFCGLRSLTHLNVSRNRIQDISEMRFGDVEDIMDLREMVSLSNMTVSGHNMTFEYYEEDPVEGIDTPLSPKDENCGQSLRELILDYNDLVRLPARPFSFLRDLRMLSVSYNDLRLISSEAFHGLESLQELYLSNNHIIALQNGTLEECTQLQRLYLNNNSISDLNENLFDHLDQLQVLDLSRNKLTLNKNLDDLFLGLHRLVILDLSHNALSNIRSPLLRDLTALQRLDLSHNFIQVIEARSFAFLSNLYDLDLSYNRLTSIDDGSFIGLAGLSIVELTNNSLKDVHPNSFGFSSNLKEVYMGANGLHSLPSALSNLSFLRKLDVHQNEIISLEPFRFNGLSNLLELDCRQNRIRNLTSASLKGLEYLEVLDLSHNNIWKLSEGVFDLTPKLKTLNLRKNVIDEIHGIFAGMESLQVLDLAENNIQMFDYSFLPRQLGTLHLQRNHIKRLGNYFKVHGVLTLEYLDASFNDIQQIGEISLPNTIRKVKLNNNIMTEVLPNTFREKAKVELVDLSMNRLEKVIPNSITVKTSNDDPGLFTELYLSGNPLVCDCDMSWLQSRSTVTGRVLLTAEPDAGIITSSALRAASVEMPAIMAPGRSSSSQRKRTEFGGSSDHIQQRSSAEQESLGSLGYRRPRVADLVTVSCSLPHSRGNSSTTRVLDALPNQFLCPYATHCFALCHCCDFIACDCQMKCPHGCSCYHDDNWSINLVDCSGNGIDHLPDRVPMDATEVYLDGNNLQTLKAHHFIGRHSLLRLYLNNSQVQTIQNRTFHGLTSLKVLHLEDNLIVHLNGFEFSGLQNLKELYLQNNHIAFLHNATFAGLKTLEVLHLDNNFLVDFPVWMLKSNTYLSSLSLLNNPWGCSCVFIEALRSYMTSNMNVVRSSKDMFCVYEGTGVVGSNMFSPTFQCDANGSGSVTRHNFSQKELPFLAGGLCGGVALLSALVVLAMLFARRRAASATKLGVSTTSSFCQEDDGKIFDAYISYSANDASFVRDVVALKLENGYPSYKLCLHSRDFTENSRLSEFITQSIGFSRRSVVVLSKNYVDNEWKNAIFKKAHVDGLESREASVISIFYDNISESILDPELRALIRKSTKLKWGDRHFWRRLNDALPQKHTHHPSLPLYLGDNLYKASVISPVLPSAVYPPLPSSASVLTGSTGLTTPSDGFPQRSSLLYQDQPTAYKAPPPPRPCQQGSLSASGDYIVMQGKECQGPGCSCSVEDSDFQNAYTYVDGAGDTASIHTYNSLEPFRLRTPSPTPAMLSSAEIMSPRSLEEEAERISLRSSSTQQYVTIDEPIRKSVRASKRKNKRSREAAAKAGRQVGCSGGGDGGDGGCGGGGSVPLRSSQTLPDIGDHFTRSSLLQKSVRRRSGSRSHSRNRSLEGRQDTLDGGSMQRMAATKQEEEGEGEGEVKEEALREESLIQNSFRRSCSTLRSLRHLDATLPNSFRRSSNTLRNPRGGGREVDSTASSATTAANHLTGSFKRSCSSSLVQPSLRSSERYSDYSTDHSGSDRSSGRSFDRSVTSGMPQESSSTSSSAGQRPLYAGVPGDCSDLSNAEECFV